jgi:hypothetical protein
MLGLRVLGVVAHQRGTWVLGVWWTPSTEKRGLEGRSREAVDCQRRRIEQGGALRQRGRRDPCGSGQQWRQGFAGEKLDAGGRGQKA